MNLRQDLPLPQGQQLQRRVEAKISDRSGRLEDESLDLDARTMAILGKRQQLSVSPNDQRVIRTAFDNLTHRQRNFGLVSLVAFSTTLIASWESIAW